MMEKTITSNLTFSNGLFVTRTGAIYVDHGSHSQVTKWSASATQSSVVMYVNRGCTNLFVAIDDTLFCSIYNGHLVITMPLNTNQSQLTAAAGTGCQGSASDMLNQPSGIYVDINMDLYVADTGNDRIQLFKTGVSTGKTVVGQAATVSFPLDQPTSVILDADNFLYIVDSGDRRIIRSGSEGSQCIIGCSISACSQPDILCRPLSAMFSSDGSLYITDLNGIQKYILATNSCGKFQMNSLPTT